jgi:ribonuclease Z
MLAKTTSIAIRPDRLPNSLDHEASCTWSPFTLVGRSRAGEGTSFAIPELKWVFDCGALVQGWKPARIFLTHTHCDHVHFLTHLKNNNSPPLVHLPVKAAPLVKAYLKAHQEMVDCITETESQEVAQYNQDLILIATQAGEEFRFRQSGAEYIMDATECDHRIPCLGYSIYKQRSKLKEQYVGLPGPEIGRLRKEGVEVTNLHREPLIWFLGDTTHKVFERYSDLLKEHRVVVVECSFIDDSDLERADTTKHMHWNYLKPFVDAHPGLLFVLIHFTLKQKSLYFRQFFLHQSIHRNVHPMLIHEEVEMEWKKSGEKGDAPCCNCFMCCE